MSRANEYTANRDLSGKHRTITTDLPGYTIVEGELETGLALFEPQGHDPRNHRGRHIEGRVRRWKR